MGTFCIGKPFEKFRIPSINFAWEPTSSQQEMTAATLRPSRRSAAKKLLRASRISSF
jgi:hypothetical protein